ncbi:MAG: hypothetical protein IJ087_06595 [Eggerthellaceae bacterium]|nr:hypothetical protein [Eggerthellaceae bacterium]
MGIYERFTALLSGRLFAEEAKKPTAWSFYFSSLNNADVLKLAVKDESELADGLSASNIVEGVLIDRYIPTEPRARRYVLEMFLTDARVSPDNGPGGIASALERMCADLAAGGCCGTAYPHTKPVLDYMNEFFTRKNPRQQLTKDRNPDYLVKCFEDLLSVLDDADEAVASCPGLSYVNDGRWMAAELSQGGYHLFNITGYIAQFALLLQNRADTFRFLVAMLNSVVHIEDTAADRFEFAAFCEAFCAEWAEYDRLLAEKKEPCDVVVRYDLAGGDWVELPADYVLLNPADASTSSNVVVIEVRNGSEYGRVIHEPSGLRSGAPHFAHFQGKPASQTSPDDTAEIRRKILDVWPDFQDVLDDEAELPEGQMLMGVFPVADSAASPWASTRCIIHRNGEGGGELGA